jgi:TRAP transporter 4TM/12TM fusion protein
MPQGKRNNPVEIHTHSGQDKVTDKIDFDQVEAIEASGHRRLGGWLARFVTIWAIFTAVFHILVLVFHPIDPWLFRNYHLVLLGVLGFILIPGWGKARDRVHWSDWVFVVLLMVVGGYIYFNFEALIWRAGVVPTTTDFFIAVIGVTLVLELVRRASGYALPLLCMVFIAYAFLGPYLPGILHHRGYSLERFFTYIYGLDGVFSVPLSISSKYIILFIIFGAFLQVSGVGRYFVKWAFAVSGHTRGGPAKVAVIASALMGTMNGTSAGNAVATGSFTIPLMRKVGYSPRFAAATEAVASTGGQIMPPVMGAGIFIMAELTGIPFQHLILAGIIPALLYFVSVYFMVDLEAVKLKLLGFPRDALPGFWPVMKQGYLFLPVLVIFAMLLMGFSVVMAGFCAIVSSLVVSWFSKATAMGPGKTLVALETGAKNAVQLMAVCAGAGIIMGVIALTGIGLKFASVILGIAGTSHLLALIFAMFISLILGMGLPTTAAYAVAASVVAPGLIQMGVAPLLAHFFVFYFACVSAITPPVALAAYAASGVSGSDPVRTAVTSFRLGVAAYIVPFMFFYAPEILLQGETLDTITQTATALVGVTALACSVQRFFFGRLSVPLTVILFIAALGLVSPYLYMDVAGFIVLGLLFVYQKFYRRHEDQAPGSPVSVD